MRTEFRQFLEGKPYLKCNAQLSELGGFYYLSLFIRIQAINASITYGSLTSASRLGIRFINGESAILPIYQACDPIVRSAEGITEYQPVFQVDKSDLNLLSGKEIDKISLSWINGVEEYDIFVVDALMKQAKCLK